MPDDSPHCLSCGGGGSWGKVEPDVCAQVPAIVSDEVVPETPKPATRKGRQ